MHYIIICLGNSAAGFRCNGTLSLRVRQFASLILSELPKDTILKDRFGLATVTPCRSEAIEKWIDDTLEHNQNSLVIGTKC